MSTVKVNTVDKRTGSTLTLGGCGTTVTLGAGATQSGFGRTGTVDWCTTAKTAPFTGVSGKGYFVNTTCGAVTVTLPATPTAGDIISIADYASTWQTNAVTLCRNSSKINGECANANLSTQGQSITLVYVDATKGWKNTMDSTSDITGAAYVTATGGTVTTCGNYKIHTFTADGCFAVSSLASNPANNTVSYMVVGGGGSGSPSDGGVGNSGGGAGGFREYKNSCDPYTASPLNGNPGGTSVTLTATTYPITVGAGGAQGTFPLYPAVGNNGSPSVFSTITSAGGGYGAGAYSAPTNPPNPGGPGGSGGGGGSCSSNASQGQPGGTGNTPPVSPSQGFPGGTGTTRGAPPFGVGGGGGGATEAGTAGGPSPGKGGDGATTSISGASTSYAGGGGGGWNGSSQGGIGGGGGATPSGSTSGTANTGGGGSGDSNPSQAAGSLGGSGIVIIRYKYQ